MQKTGDTRLGLFAWFGVYVPFANRMKMFRDAGFTHTCLWWEQENADWYAECLKMPEQARNAGLVVDNVHVAYRGCNRFWSSGAEERAAQVERHVTCIEDCARFGVPGMVMHVTMGTTLPPPCEVGIDAVQRVVEVAESRGVWVALENTRRLPHLDAVLAAIGSPALRLCYDAGHDWRFENPLEVLRRWRHRLGAVHLSDTDGVLDRHWLPGEGIVDFGKLAGVLDWQAFEGPLMLEVTSRDKKEQPEKFLARAYESAVALSRQLLGPSA